VTARKREREGNKGVIGNHFSSARKDLFFRPYPSETWPFRTICSQDVRGTTDRKRRQSGEEAKKKTKGEKGRSSALDIVRLSIRLSLIHHDSGLLLTIDWVFSVFVRGFGCGCWEYHKSASGKTLLSPVKGNKRRKPPHLVVLGFRFALVRPTDGSYLLPCFLSIEKTARVHIRFYYQDEKKERKNGANEKKEV